MEAMPGLDAAIARAKSGDEEAFRFLYISYQDNVRGYVRSRLRDDDDAEDVTQQVFMRVLTSIAGYEQREVPFLAWLLRIAHNASIDHVRRRKPAAPLLEAEPEAPRLSERDRRELGRALQDAFAGLPEDQRRVLVMRHVAGLSPGEIAERLGRTTTSVHCLHHRARRDARRALEAAGVAPVAA
jgi:RNA polymerase sigma-70 factor, ECF subfamily